MQVPVWRTDASAIARARAKPIPATRSRSPQEVLRKQSELGPAAEPSLVRVLGMLDVWRCRLVRDRSQALQRLPGDWTQFDRVSEIGVIRCDRRRRRRRDLRLHDRGDARVDRHLPDTAAGDRAQLGRRGSAALVG